MSGLVEGNSRFALDLYQKLRDQPGNLFFSPNSISTALAMTYAGARGETAEQMARVLHFPVPQDQLPEAFAELLRELRPQAAKPGFQLDVANRLWGQQGYHFMADFLAITRNFYHAELAEVDFAGQPEAARARINLWVEQETHEKIKDLVPPKAIGPDTVLVLTNAIYFKGDWSHPFPKAATRDEPFHVSGEQTVHVPLMHRTDDLRFAAIDALQILELNYGKGELSALFLLPEAIDGLPALEARLNDDNFTRWISVLARRKVEVFLPRFKLSSQFSLPEVLAAMGMTHAFDSRADFSGISTQEKLFISDVLHKAYVDLNEEGTEAAAATAVVMSKMMAVLPKPPVVFRADHPFLFLIVDNRTRSILFLGRVVSPKS
ncbi:MAG: serpin family protein [Isosphaeraceae bacterium]